MRCYHDVQLTLHAPACTWLQAAEAAQAAAQEAAAAAQAEAAAAQGQAAEAAQKLEEQEAEVRRGGGGEGTPWVWPFLGVPSLCIAPGRRAEELC